MSRSSAFRIGERVLRIRADHPLVDDYVRRAFRRIQTETGETIDPSYVDEGAIFVSGDEPEFWFGGRRLKVERKFEGVLDAAVAGAATLLGRTLRRLEKQRALYATGLAFGDTCVAIAAPSGIGKTTLALELLRRGWATFGDEYVMLERRTLVLTGLQIAFMVREPSLVALGDARLESVTRSGELLSERDGVRTWYDLDVEEAFGPAAIAAPRPLTHVVLLARSGDGASSLESLSPATAALELMPHLFSECLRVADMWETVERFSDVACYRLYAHDHRAAADLLEEVALAGRASERLERKVRIGARA